MIDPRLSTTAVWKEALKDLLEHGRSVSPLSAGAAWKGKASRELLAYQTVVPMAQPVVRSETRKLGLRFMCAEAAWIASGDNRVATIAPYSKRIAEFSDDGIRFAGAYGPRFVEQLSYAVASLADDPASRQAVVSIWRENPRSSKDVGCTLSWQFVIRDGRLNCIATMRSSDIWTGWPFDVFNFSIAAAVVALELRGRVGFGGIELGELYLTAGSQHVYEVDAASAYGAVVEPDSKAPVAPLRLDEFQGAEDLIAHLWALARRDGPADRRWLGDLFL